MDLSGLDEFLRNSGNFVTESDVGGPHLARVMSDFQPDDIDSGNAASSPEYAFVNELQYDSPLGGSMLPPNSDNNMQLDPSGTTQQPNITQHSLDHTNPFASELGKRNPLYDSNEALNQLGLAPLNVGIPPIPSATSLNNTPGSSLHAMARVAVTQRQYLNDSAKPKKETKKSPMRKSTTSKKKRKLVTPKQEEFVDDEPDFVEMDEEDMERSMKPEGAKKISFHHHEPHDSNMNCRLFDEKLDEISIWNFDIEADKGFNHSILDDSFVCQKKNHFQVSVNITLNDVPKFVQIDNAVRPISELFVAIWGLKDEDPPSTVGIEQSHVDRTKKPFEPVRVTVDANGHTKATFNRLHFSETTANNMRKKGKPNPEQRYFVLLIEFHAMVDETVATIHCEKSERIIVRASNPGQFDGEIDMKWVKGKVADSIVHHGPVGINTDKPMGALAVNGNMAVTGSIMHPSDRRVKQDLVRTNTQQQMQNVQDLQLYQYQLVDDWSKITNRHGQDRMETGVIAQDLQKVIPDAVRNTKQSYRFEDGTDLEDLLVVDMDRVFMENVGAVQELCKMTENLDQRIKELEELNAAVQSGTFRRRTHKKRRNDNNGLDALLSDEEALENKDLAFPFFKTLLYIFVAMVIFSLLAVTVILLSEREEDDGGTGTATIAAPNGTTAAAVDLTIFASTTTTFISTISSTLTTST
eukprot:m.187148 g.187148  ORF g.187148 m.187148 type:complete len:695 (-) comp32294_c0_seq2:277-2361(-)